MIANKFEIRWIGYYEPDQKIWGWFINTSENNPNPHVRNWGLRNCYCFWAVCGKTISINKHVMLPHNMDGLQNKKLANKYQQISEDKLLEMWPSFHGDLHDKFIFASLSEQI